MNIKRAMFAAAGGAALAALTLAPVPVGAQEGVLPISVSPTSGPAGTTFTITGSGCTVDGVPGDLEAYLFDFEGELLDVWSGSVAADGTWSASVQAEATDPLGIYSLSATCWDGPGEDALIVADYDFADFELTAAAPETPETPETPESPAAPAVTPAVAPAATAVRATPSYTG